MTFSPTSAERQIREEQLLFAQFLDSTALNIPRASIESRRAPEPDILCLLDGQPIAFELGELSDEDFRAGVSVREGSRRLLEEARHALQPVDRERFERLYADASMQVSFVDAASLRRRAEAAGLLLHWLAVCEPREGRLIGEQLPQFAAGVVQQVRVSRPAPMLMLDASYSTWVLPPTLRIAERKFAFDYCTPHPMELLLHFHLQLTPRDVFLARHRVALCEQLDRSRFRRVWVFNPAERSSEQAIWLVHPPLP